MSSLVADPEVTFVPYRSEADIPTIMSLVAPELSEPYSVFTYRYFLHNWPSLTVLALSGSTVVGCVVCKVDADLSGSAPSALKSPGAVSLPTAVAGEDGNEDEEKHGYIGMLTVCPSHRKKGIGSSLIVQAITRLRDYGCQTVMLETEITNTKSIALYERLGFIREEYLTAYYLNWGDAYRLRLHFEDEPEVKVEGEEREGEKGV